MRKTFMLAGLLGVTGATTPRVEAPRVVEVQAFDYRFEAPSTIPAGTITFRLRNLGREIHHLWIVQLTQGKTTADFLKATQVWGTNLKMPSWAVDVGGPNTAGAHERAEGTVTLQPGTYILVCWVPSADGVLHIMKGMIRSLEVTEKRATPPAEPTADVALTLDDYSFTFSQPLIAGHRVIRIDNRATQSHEAVIARLLPGRTLLNAVVWMNTGQSGRPPVVMLGGASGIAQGRRMYITVDLEPGRYVLLCFIPDAKDGRPHSDHGMVKEFTVEE